MIDPKTQQPALRVRPGTNDSNLNGSVFGGWLVSQMDIAASITAGEAAKGMTATRAIKDLTFIQPIFTYDIVSIYTEIISIGKTSLNIAVEVFAQRTNALSVPKMDEMIKVSDAIFVFVAISKPGEKRVIEK